MSGIGELQTVSAILDLLQLTYKAGKFLKQVHDAPKVALDIGEAICRLDDVLDGVRAVLKTREQHEGSTPSADTKVVSSIRTSVEACKGTLEALEGKLGSFDVSHSLASSVVERVKTVCHQPTIRRMQHDLDVRVGVLQTNLLMLQLFDQSKMRSEIAFNHAGLQRAIVALTNQMNCNNQMLSQFLEGHRTFAQPGSDEGPESVVELIRDDVSQDAITSLAECLLEAEDVRSQYRPADISTLFSPDYEIRYTDSRISIETRSPSSRSNSPHSPRSSSPLTSPGGSEDGDVIPLSLLNENIEVCIGRATRERAAGHLQQAEENLSRAIRYSEMRESYHGIPFENEVALQEERAVLYLGQNRFGEAIAKLHLLLRESQSSGVVEEAIEADDLAQARQNQLLAMTYYERYLNHAQSVERREDEDMENAEKHAWKALKKRHKLSISSSQSVEKDGSRECSNLLIRILESNDKTAEAHVIRKWRANSSSSKESSCLRSPLLSGMDAVSRFNLLITAIQHQDNEEIQELLEEGDIDLESKCKHGKTPLMHAVEHGESGTLHKLLDPDVGACADTADKHGMTACHLAARAGYLENLRALLHHGADTERRDNKGETVVVTAVRAGQESIVQHLFNERPDSFRTRTSDEWSVLHHAIRNQDAAMTRLLLSLSPELKDAADSAGKTALHHAVESGRLGQVTALLEHRHHADVNAVDSVLRTPLYLATSKPMTSGRASMVRLLLDHGAQFHEHRSAPWSNDYQALQLEKPRRVTV